MAKLQGRIEVKRLYGKINLVPSDGSSGGPLQAKTAYPSHSEQVIAPDEDFYGLVSVTVKPTPRLSAFSVNVAGDDPVDMESVILPEFLLEVSIKSAYQETVIENVPYLTHAGKWFPAGAYTASTPDPVVTYSFAVERGSTYTITMTEIGNRLRCAFTTVDPSTITGDADGILSEFIDITSNLVVGYEFTYTATQNGWYLVYVSNQDERPTITVKTSKTIWVDEA